MLITATMKLIQISILLAIVLLCDKKVFAQSAVDSMLVAESTHTFDFEPVQVDSLFDIKKQLKSIWFYDVRHIKRKSISFYESGSVRSVLNYGAEGVAQGVFLRFYPEGALETYSFSMNGVGFNVMYYEDGRIKSHNRTRDLLPVDYACSFCSNGVLFGEAFYDSTGYDRTGYYCNGLLREQGRMLGDNIKVGEWKYWNEQEELVRKEIYKDGDLVEMTEY
jgi:antitoxin component YwqK of YwqJK toxin-antitoxin module